jgi:hypothetical protein
MFVYSVYGSVEGFRPVAGNGHRMKEQAKDIIEQLIRITYRIRSIEIKVGNILRKIVWENLALNFGKLGKWIDETKVQCVCV